MDAYGRVELGSRGRVLLAMPAVMIVAMVAIGMLANSEDGPRDRDALSSASGAIARTSPRPSHSDSPCPRDADTRLRSSAQRIDGLGPYHITVTLDGDWCHVTGSPWVWAAYLDGGGGRVDGKIGFGVAGHISCVDTPTRFSGPIAGSEILLDGLAGERFELGPALASCDPSFVLNALADPGARGAVSYVNLWLSDIGDARLAAYTVAPDLRGHDSLWRLVESSRIGLFGEFPPEPFPEGPIFPPEGKLVERTSYWASVDSRPSSPGFPVGFPFWFTIPSAGWTSSGPASDGHAGSLSIGTLGSADGAVVRFSNPDRVYADPCDHQLGPAVGDSVDALVAAIATIPGVAVEGPVSAPLRFSVASQLVLTLPTELGCDPSEFALWHDDDTGARVAAAPGPTITLWVFNPNDRSGFGRIVVEAETFPGASPELLRDIERIVDSIGHIG